MVKVKWQEVTVRIPVIDESGDHDAKIADSDYQALRYYYDQLNMLSGQTAIIGGAAVSANQQNGWRTVDETWSAQLRAAKQGVEIAQIDPPINTAVTDSEMRSSAPQMSLEEFREPPARTKTPPRPRANSWRHENGE